MKQRLFVERSSRTIKALNMKSGLTAAQVGRASGVIALGGFGVVYGGVLVRTPVARAERLAALLLLALVAMALDVFSVVDQRVTVGAFDGVAVLLLVWCVERNEEQDGDEVNGSSVSRIERVKG